jgi:hypothetical protein
MAANVLDGLFGINEVLIDGVPTEFRPRVNLLGGWGAAVGEDAEGNETLELVPPGGGSGGSGGGGMGFRFTYTVPTLDADPGAGNLRISAASYATAGTFTLYIDLAEYGGTDVTSWIDKLDDYAGAIKGVMRLQSLSDPTKWVEYTLTAWTTASGYRKLTAVYKDGPGGLLTAAGDTFVSFDYATSIVGGTSVTVSAAGAVARAALTGDVTAPADSNATTIAAGAVTTTKILDANVTDAKLATSYIKADGTRAFTGNQSAGGFKHTNLANGATGTQDAATVAQTEALVKKIPVVTEAGSARTLTAADAGKYIRCTAACVITVNSGVFAADDFVLIRAASSGVVSFAGTATITPPFSNVNTSSQQGATIGLVFTSSSTADSFGDLSDA